MIVATPGWANLYRYFSDATIWPRGLPLDAIHAPLPAYDTLHAGGGKDCPIQQGLADANPDVDAIYRLTLPLPQNFRADRRVALAPGTWCPFSSQNTTWWPDTFPLLYLPAYCSFRMTDIWRGFIAQRIAAQPSTAGTSCSTRRRCGRNATTTISCAISPTRCRGISITRAYARPSTD